MDQDHLVAKLLLLPMLLNVTPNYVHSLLLYRRVTKQSLYHVPYVKKH